MFSFPPYHCHLAWIILITKSFAGDSSFDNTFYNFRLVLLVRKNIIGKISMYPTAFDTFVSRNIHSSSFAVSSFDNSFNLVVVFQFATTIKTYWILFCFYSNTSFIWFYINHTIRVLQKQIQYFPIM